MKNIVQTGFYTSIISYFAFAFFDYLRPGFVSHNFSVHWFLLVAIVFGVVWSSSGFKKCQGGLGAALNTVRSWSLSFIISLVLFVVIWREGEVFGDFRILLALIGFLIPWISMRLLRD